MRRLYVGGLGHTISQKDLRDRFGKFGEVSDVEIITRNDEHGAPLKTFGYVNINISDSDFKRCLTVLNKSKWKGGTLQIELAKESFLHRLAEERLQTVGKVQTAVIDPKDKMVESLKEAGVEDFHMKAAVPGTEIPGHKNWVVSKFGRVLPVLNLKCQGKNKVFKYDPSKHCHNIKKLDPKDDSTSVSKLTWEIDGGNDEISKKRRGEFPPQKKCFKKTKIDSTTRTIPSGIPKVTASEKRTSLWVRQNDSLAKGTPNHLGQKRTFVLDSDADSEDEITMLVEQELSQDQKCTEDDGDLEVVGDDFVVKSNMFWGEGENGLKTELGLKTSNMDEDYDSADTDEILTQKKNASKADGLTKYVPVCENILSKSGRDEVKKEKKKVSKKGAKPASTESDYSAESSSESLDSEYEAMMSNCPRLDLSLADLERLVQNMGEAASDEGDEVLNDPLAGPSDQPEASSSSRTTPLRTASKKTGNNPDDILASLFEPDVEEEEEKTKDAKLSLPAFVGTKDLFDSVPLSSGSRLKRPTENTASKSKGNPKNLKQDSKTLPTQCAFEGRSKDQSPGPSHEEVGSGDPMRSTLSEKEQNRTELPHTDSSSECSSSDEMERDPVHKVQPVPKGVLKVDHSSSSQPVSGEHSKENITLPSKAANTHIKLGQARTMLASNTGSDSSTSTGESETSDEEEHNDSNEVLGASDVLGSKLTRDDAASSFQQSAASDPVKQQQDNLKRLAALEKRQKQAEQQKKLIQGALSTVDCPNANKGKHIVFDSEDEVNDDEETSQKKSLFDESSLSDEEDGSGAQRKKCIKEKKLQEAGSSKLFDSSEDEDGGREEDCFQIKPQFEGKAGQKLMELQSRFGTDSRFQMDAKFLESDEERDEPVAESSDMTPEQELVEEKKKNLAILQSVLNVSIQPSNTRKSQRQGKTFKDMAALHYDPTEEAHTAFEAKTEPPKKESKAARRKKREEAKKLPEVSNKIYYDVTMDLKESFGTLKESQHDKEEVPWDKEEDENETTVEDAHVLSFSSNVENEKDATSGFKFSFFGDDTTSQTTTKTEYKIETLKEAKKPWQVDPRLQDSSSEDEDDVDEEGKDQTASVSSTQDLAPTKRFFFFYEGDIRLKEGPSMFCRNESLEEQKESWEEKRAGLREDYRKKHKDARRWQNVKKS
ncbi:nucleolar protein 8 isoform X2 [Brachyhypopomus gauderio]|uniref:nucleolar protein 8 isoform X2 n=1 Tax=Brachyhypopomus gauderio TaxID=698409 RepID=UPI0040420A66